MRLLTLVFLFGVISLASAQVLDPLSGRIGAGLIRDKASGFAIVDFVAAQSPADVAGIKKGDIVTAIDSVSTATMTDADALHACNGTIGTSVALTVRRAGVADLPIAVPRASFSNAYLAAAQAGDARAQYGLGFYYEHTLPGLRDYGQAADWYRKAADQGFAPAQVNLAAMLRFGWGVHADMVASTALLQKAAAQGDSTAERDLALRYYYGLGIGTSYKDAFAWFHDSRTPGRPLFRTLSRLPLRKRRRHTARRQGRLRVVLLGGTSRRPGGGALPRLPLRAGRRRNAR